MNLLERRREEWERESLMLPIWWQNNRIFFLDQRALPFEKIVVETDSLERVCTAIKDMEIRGSGAIGITGAYGMYLAVTQNPDLLAVRKVAQLLKQTRPTAINLHKTVDEVLSRLESDPQKIEEHIESIIVQILDRQLSFERALGAFGAQVIADGDSILTHCNSGALAGSGFGGRALSVIRSAWEEGKKIHVYVSETRPYLQGARITAFELETLGIPYTVITDSTSAFLMSQDKIQKVVVGSDRVASNGDLINKVGTFMHALVASYHNVPFFTATSSHTIDHNLVDGNHCPIEFRDEEEVKSLRGVKITLDEAHALYPAFDITPNKLISGIVTEKGIIPAPYSENLRILKDKEET